MQDTISYNVISRMGHYSIGKLDLFNSELKINIRILIDIYIYIFIYIVAMCETVGLLYVSNHNIMKLLDLNLSRFVCT